MHNEDTYTDTVSYLFWWLECCPLSSRFLSLSWLVSLRCGVTTKTFIRINYVWHLLWLNTKYRSYKLSKSGECEALPVKHTTGRPNSLYSQGVLPVRFSAEDLAAGASDTETLVINTNTVWLFTINSCLEQIMNHLMALFEGTDHSP